MLIQLVNHQEKETLADVLRLFYAQIGRTDEQSIRVQRFQETLSAGEDRAETVIISALGRTVDKADLRNHRLNDRIDVTTSFAAEPSSSLRAAVRPSEVRRELKRQLYLLLSRLEKIEFPWGSLTGIRPTQIAWQSYCDAAGDSQEAVKNLTGHWLVSPDKAQLAVETALAEEEAMSRLNPDLPLLYLGIPFCPSRCAYCSFISRDALRQKDALPGYVQALQAEIRAVGRYFKERGLPFQAVYLGGGTPTSLPPEWFAELIATIREAIVVTDHCEITVEAGRPDTISSEVLAQIQTLGEVRLCINPQTMQDHTLQRIGRRHSAEQTLEAYALAREAGFKHINMDLILGLPGESGDDFLASVEQLIDLKPESITLHTLALKRSAHLQQEAAELYLRKRFPDAALSAALTAADEKLRKQRYLPYYLYRQKNVRGGLENTGYTLPGHACLYNVGMMSDRFSVVGLGSGSSSKKVRGKRVDRCHNSKDLLDYSKRIDEMISRKLDFFSDWPGDPVTP